MQQAQPFVTCNQTATNTGLGNAAFSASLTPPAGQYVYICSIYISEAMNTVGVATAGPAPLETTTNLMYRKIKNPFLLAFRCIDSRIAPNTGAAHLQRKTQKSGQVLVRTREDKTESIDYFKGGMSGVLNLVSTFLARRC